MHKIVAVQGLQYGSEAKGSIAAGIARKWQPDTVATAWGPNAGHTVRDGGFRFVSTMLASASLYPSATTILVGPGSVVDFGKLSQEVELAGDRLRGKLLIIHPQAAYVKPEHVAMEQELLRIGSTMKGTMQAVYSKMRRYDGATVRGATRGLHDVLLMVAAKVGLMVSFSEELYDTAIDQSEKLLIEGAQGFSLSMHGEFYPYCTSRDVSTAQLLADCRIPFPTASQNLAVVGVLRTYPIRVANRRSTDGQDYTSGGIYSDQHELNWKVDLNREPELTTVTRLPRRIFSFSYEQVYKAVRIMRPSTLALTFCDYTECRPQFDEIGRGQAGPAVMRLVRAIEDTAARANCRTFVDTLSYGPDLADIFDIKTKAGSLGLDPFDYEGKNYHGLAAR